VAQQFVNLRANPISSGTGTIGREGLVWRCQLSPTPLSRVYSVRIEYGRGRPPDVIVENPDLRVGSTHLARLQREPYEPMPVSTGAGTVGTVDAA
jgi:hypothetical protein